MPRSSKLRNIVAPVLALDANDAAVVTACLEAEDTVRELQAIDFHDRELSQKSAKQMPVP